MKPSPEAGAPRPNEVFCGRRNPSSPPALSIEAKSIKSPLSKAKLAARSIAARESLTTEVEFTEVEVISPSIDKFRVPAREFVSVSVLSTALAKSKVVFPPVKSMVVSATSRSLKVQFPVTVSTSSKRPTCVPSLTRAVPPPSSVTSNSLDELARGPNSNIETLATLSVKSVSLTVGAPPSLPQTRFPDPSVSKAVQVVKSGKTIFPTPAPPAFTLIFVPAVLVIASAPVEVREGEISEFEAVTSVNEGLATISIVNADPPSERVIFPLTPAVKTLSAESPGSVATVIYEAEAGAPPAAASQRGTITPPPRSTIVRTSPVTFPATGRRDQVLVADPYKTSPLVTLVCPVPPKVGPTAAACHTPVVTVPSVLIEV